MRRRRLAGALAALTAGVALTVTGGVDAPEAEAAACSGTTGVTVVVDFRALGGSVRVDCAPGDPASGLAALQGAGFSYAYVPRQPGLVCQINGLPNPCNNAPTTAYWSYWHAQRGGSWTYSNSGAGSRNPAPGTVEGWAFGAGQPPGVAPPAPAQPPPATTKPAPKPPPSSQPPGQRTTAPRPGDDDRATRQGTAPNAESPSTRAGSRASTTPTDPDATDDTQEDEAAAPGVSPGDTEADDLGQTGADGSAGGGGSAGFLAGTGLVLGLGALGFWLARRRRTANLSDLE